MSQRDTKEFLRVPQGIPLCSSVVKHSRSNRERLVTKRRERKRVPAYLRSDVRPLAPTDRRFHRPCGWSGVVEWCVRGGKGGKAVRLLRRAEAGELL